MDGGYTFEVEPSLKALTRLCAWGSVGFVGFFFVLPFWSGEQDEAEGVRLMWASAIGAGVFGLLAWYLFRMPEKFARAALALDSDGIWPARLSKDTSLVPWEKFQSINERQYLQRLDLVGKNGEVLIRAEYQLSKFPVLRSMLLEKIPWHQAVSVPTHLQKTIFHHAFNIGAITGFSILGWVVGRSNPVLGYGGMAILVVMCVQEYLTTVSRLDVLPDRLRIGFPIRIQEVLQSDIESIELSDTVVKGSRHPEVLIFVSGREKPLKLSKLGIDATMLQQFLEDWKVSVR